MREEIPEIIKEALKGINPIFVAFNGSVQRTGWGNDIDLWIVVEDEKVREITGRTFPQDWDVEMVPESRFEFGVENADGIYIDLVIKGSVITDKRGWKKTLTEYLSTTPTKEEIDYHVKEAHFLFLLAEKRLYEMKYYVKIKELEEKKKTNLDSSFKLPVPQGFFNPLHYSLSYAYISREYKKGRRVIISEKLR